MRHLLSLSILLSLMGWSAVAQPQFPPIPKLPTAPPTNAMFYDSLASGAKTPWTFYQGSHLFTAGVLRISATPNNGAYAYVRTNWVNISVSADVRLTNGSGAAAVGLRYNPTNGANYQAWIYDSGRFTIEKYNNWFNSHTELAGITIGIPGTNINNVKLSMTNNILVAALNNNTLLTCVDTSTVPLLQGGIDLSVRGNSNAITAEFANVTVYGFSIPPAVTVPSITNGLTNIIALQGSSVTFSIGASNATYYQWQVPGYPLFVSTNNTYTITNVQPSNQGIVAVFVSTNKLARVYSSAYLSVGTTNILADCMPVGGCSVNLAWCPTVSTDSVAYYSIYYGTGSPTNWTPTVWDTNIPCGAAIISEGTNWCRCYSTNVNVGNNTSAVISGLCSGIIYYFAATVMGTDGTESDFSNEASYTPPYAVLTNGFLATITYLGNNQVQLSAKVCPASMLTIHAKPDLLSPWSKMATNIPVDAYGNFFYNCGSTQTVQFFKLQIQ